MHVVLLNLLLALLGAAGLTLSFPFSTRALGLEFVGLPEYEIPKLPATGDYLQFAWLGFVALLPLLILAKRSTPRAAFGWGYLCGLLWLAASWGWLTSFGVVPLVLLAIFFALPVGLFCYLAHWVIAMRQPAQVVWLLPVLWTGLEYLRSFGFWAFPWNLLGYSQARNLLLVQSAEWGGVYAVTFFVALANCALFLLLTRLEPKAGQGLGPRITFRRAPELQAEGWSEELPGDPEPDRLGTYQRGQRLGHALTALGIVLLTHAYGAVRLWQLDQQVTPHSVRLALVQGGLSTNESWNKPGVYEKAVEAYVMPSRRTLDAWDTRPKPKLVQPPPSPNQVEPMGPPRILQPSAPPAYSPIQPSFSINSPQHLSDSQPRADRRKWTNADPTVNRVAQAVAPADPQHPALLLAWPESCIPRSVRQPLSASVPPEVQGLLSGHTDCALLYGAGGFAHDMSRYENGGILLTDKGDTSWVHSKLRLVPYGEVVPFREAVRFLEYPWGPHDVFEGRRPEPFTYAGHKFGAMVCFDNVFGFLPRREVRQGAEALLLITNNSWYDLASGVRQHCDMDVLRAVELRRALGRSATTGWSHLILPSGRIAASSVHGPQAVVEDWMPLGKGLSPYARLGDAFAALCLVVSAVATAWTLLVGKSEQML
jgi:apolipoprotein N-acyltransferase